MRRFLGPQARLEAIEILSLPDDRAVVWLKSAALQDRERRQKSVSSDEGGFPLAELENIRAIASFVFARRKSQSLKFAVARYGNHRATLRKLLEQGSRTLRLALLSNDCVGPGNLGYVVKPEEALNYFRDPNTHNREIRMLLTNPYLSRPWLADLVKHLREAGPTNDDLLQTVVSFLSINPLLNDKLQSVIMDGFREYQFHRINRELLMLLEHVPIKVTWAYRLETMLRAINIDTAPDFETDIIERWQAPEGSSENDKATFRFLRQEIMMKLILRGRSHLSSHKYGLDHPDPAVRIANFQTLSPHVIFHPARLQGDQLAFLSFKNGAIDEQELSENTRIVYRACKSYYERDGNEFVQALILNDAFWKKADWRIFVGNIAWDLADDPRHNMDLPNLYQVREERLQSQHPEWFVDHPGPDAAATIQEVFDLVDAMKADLDTMAGKLEKLSGENELGVLNYQLREVERSIGNTEASLEEISSRFNQSEHSQREASQNLRKRVEKIGSSISLVFAFLIAILAILIWR